MACNDFEVTHYRRAGIRAGLKARKATCALTVFITSNWGIYCKISEFFSPGERQKIDTIDGAELIDILYVKCSTVLEYCFILDEFRQII